MLAKLVTLSTATQAQILADMVALACGASIASLSAGCDKANSQILVNTEATGWSLLDANGPSNGKVITAKDFSGNDKFLNFYPYSASGLVSYSYDTYNPVTHVGTNLSGTANQTFNLSLGNVQTLYVYATARSVLFINNVGTLVIGSLEFTREAPFLSNANYHAHAPISNWSNNNIFTVPRLKNFGAPGDLLNQGCVAIITSVGGTTFQGNYRDASDNIVYPILDAYAVLNNPNYNLPLGKLYDIVCSSSVMGAFMDTVTVDDVVYFVIPNAGFARVLAKFG